MYILCLYILFQQDPMFCPEAYNGVLTRSFDMLKYLRRATALGYCQKDENETLNSKSWNTLNPKPESTAYMLYFLPIYLIMNNLRYPRRVNHRLLLHFPTATVGSVQDCTSRNGAIIGTASTNIDPDNVIYLWNIYGISVVYGTIYGISTEY